MKNEFKVGLFVFLTILFLFFLTTQVNSFKNFSKKGYVIHAYLKNAAGLEKNSKIKANGIDVGYIKDLKIDKNKIEADLFIDESVKIPDNSTLTPTQESMLGGKYAAISLGDSNNYLKSDSFIKNGVELASINQASDSMTKAANEFKKFIGDLETVLDEKSKNHLKDTFANIDKITSDLKEFTSLGKLNKAVDNFNNMAENLSKTSQKFSKTADLINNKLPNIMDNIENLIKDLKYASSQIREKVPALADRYTEVADELAKIIRHNENPLNSSLKSANSFFSKGQDAFDKVDSILKQVDKIQLQVAMHGEVMSKDSYTKGYLSLDYKPSDTKTYKFDVIGMDDYSNMSDDGKFIPPKKHQDGKILVSAQMAKRFDDLTLRTGIIENTFGAGIDYYLFNKQLKASAELYDMNAQNDVRGDKMHAKVSARYTLLKHLDLYGGYDNFLNSDTKNLFFGVGVRFYDNDLKTLIMSQSLGSFARSK